MSRSADATTAGRTMASATSIVGAAMVSMSVLMYAFTLLAAHTLGPRPYGVLAALLGMLIVVNVGSLSLQATAARRVAVADVEERPAIARQIERAGLGVSVALTVGLLLLAWPISRFLQASTWPVLITAITAGPLTMTGAYAGIVQGQHRWARLAAIYLAMGAGRITCGGFALLIHRGLVTALVGVAAGSFAPALVGRFQRGPVGIASGPHSTDRLLAELWRNGYTLLAFYVFTNLDVLMARHILDHHEAGIYAAGAILTKTALFLPAFVLVAAFPSMARDERRWRVTFAVVACVGLIGLVAAFVLPGLAVTYAGGAEYQALRSYAALFVLEGVLMALLQILVYDKIAARSSLAVLLWITVVVIATIALTTVHSLVALVSVVIGAALVAIVVTIAWSARPTWAT